MKTVSSYCSAFKFESLPILNKECVHQLAMLPALVRLQLKSW
jgi:hypothetical protein